MFMSIAFIDPHMENIPIHEVIYLVVCLHAVIIIPYYSRKLAFVLVLFIDPCV